MIDGEFVVFDVCKLNFSKWMSHSLSEFDNNDDDDSNQQIGDQQQQRQ